MARLARLLCYPCNIALWEDMWSGRNLSGHVGRSIMTNLCGHFLFCLQKELEVLVFALCACFDMLTRLSECTVHR